MNGPAHKRAFAPYETLAARLLPHAVSDNADASHDVAHLHRVWTNASHLHAEEGGDLEILLVAAVLHDCVAVEKNDPNRARASRLAAEKARLILKGDGWDEARIGDVAHAIEAHSFSAGLKPETLEAKILQDADRLDALGAMGIARCFYVAGRLGTHLYDWHDPQATQRAYDDQVFSIDHFQTKLLKLQSGFQTNAGRKLAELRHERVQRFLDDFMDEV